MGETPRRNQDLRPGRDTGGNGPPGQQLSVGERSAQVWDMVLNLLHPAFLYVLFQVMIMTHMADAPVLQGLRGLSPELLGACVIQFLGAWAVFYTTLLRDMGFRSPEGTVLLLAAFLGAGLQYVLFPDPDAAEPARVQLFLGAQLVLAAVLWPVTLLRWRRLKRRELGGGNG